MRQWVEKLAKHLENEGVWVEKRSFFGDNSLIETTKYRVSIWARYNELEIKKLNSEEHTKIKIYEDESDLLAKIRNKIIENTKDNFINELNNLD